jgi:RNA polymerase sigma-70 factor (ECF subfamily)
MNEFVYLYRRPPTARSPSQLQQSMQRWQALTQADHVALGLSPVVALNRAMAIAQNDGPDRGLAAIQSIEGVERFASYPFYPASLGELELRRGRAKEAKAHFKATHRLARNDGERRFLKSRITACERRR